LKAAVLLGRVGLCGRTAELRIQPEFLRTTPTGEVVGQDRAASGHAPAVFAVQIRAAGQVRFGHHG